MKICLDAGHYGKYNQSPCNGAYYESDMTWKLHLLLKHHLEAYGIQVVTTRKNQETDRKLYDRGAAAKGCSLFISLHSNAAQKESIDYPVSYCAVNGSADNIGMVLAECVEQVMNTVQKARIEHRAGKNGDYYGVLRGATAAEVPGLILEHSFHTNPAATEWLLSESNLDKLAKAEAEAIAKFYGISSSGNAPQEEGFVLASDKKRWQYQFQDGSYAAQGWHWLTEKNGGTSGWYLFDKDGYMLTGYQTAADGRNFFLCPTPGISEGQCMVTDDQGQLKIAEYDMDARKYII
ncbi:MAG: N-acetylmuramoyl-L-alanine amidase [Hungatella sp.]|nr:N-acetylmuramoyl-L-alanine amidase [Hungatella sp.]